MTSPPTKHDPKKDNVVVEREGFTSDELVEQSTYDEETEIERRMRRGDESEGEPDERDVAGTSDPQDISPEISSDRERPA